MFTKQKTSHIGRRRRSGRLTPFVVALGVMLGTLAAPTVAVATPSAVTAALPADPAPGDAPAPAAGEATTETQAACRIGSGTYTNFTTAQGPRKFVISVPPGASNATPMVMSLHGATGSSDIQRGVSTLSETVETQDDVMTQAVMPLGQREGFISVFPQARGEAPYTAWDVKPNSIDVTYVAALLGFLHASGCGQPSNTTVSGFSMGAMLTSRLVCSYASRLSAAVFVAGVLPPQSGCRPGNTKILTIHSTVDPTVPYTGGGLPGSNVQLWPVYNMDRNVMTQRWAYAKDCPSPGFATRVGNATFVNYECSWSDSRMVIHGQAAHQWNGPGIVTSELLWAFARPARACTVVPQQPANPALANGMQQRLARDIVFSVNFERELKRQIPCNAHLRNALSNALRQTINAAPNGVAARQIRFSIQQDIRKYPNGATAQALRRALQGR